MWLEQLTSSSSVKHEEGDFSGAVTSPSTTAAMVTPGDMQGGSQLQEEDKELLLKLGLVSEDGNSTPFRWKDGQPSHYLTDTFSLTGFRPSKPFVIQINSKYTLSIEPDAIAMVLGIPNTGSEVVKRLKLNQSGLRKWLYPHVESSIMTNHKLTNGYRLSWFKPPLQEYMTERKKQLLMKGYYLSCGQAHALLREMEEEASYNWASNRSSYIKDCLISTKPASTPLLLNLIEYVEAALSSKVLKMVDTHLESQKVPALAVPVQTYRRGLRRRKQVVSCSTCEEVEVVAEPQRKLKRDHNESSYDEGNPPQACKGSKVQVDEKIREQGRITEHQVPRTLPLGEVNSSHSGNEKGAVFGDSSVKKQTTVAEVGIEDTKNEEVLADLKNEGITMKKEIECRDREILALKKTIEAFEKEISLYRGQLGFNCPGRKHDMLKGVEVACNAWGIDGQYA